MALSVEDRGMVEKIIDEGIRQIPSLMQLFRNEELLRLYQIKTVEDFIFGITYGQIQLSFGNHFRLTHNQDPDHEQMQEFASAFNNRIKEIKEAIFQTG